MRNRLTGIAYLLFWMTANAFGQALSGTVVGTVIDPTGAADAEATVSVLNEDTGLVRNTVTNADGQFRADTFPTGALGITVERAGFDKLVRTGLRLTAADTIAVNLQLKVGNVQQTVEVKGEAGLVQSQSAAISTIITNQQIMETPLNGRSFTQMLQ